MRQSAGLILVLGGCGAPPEDTLSTGAPQEMPALHYLQEGPDSGRQFRSQDGTTLVQDPMTGRIENGSEVWESRLKWGSWGLLQDCVGDPMQPHLRDPEALLGFRTSRPGAWVVRYSGLNDCGLSGEVVLQANRDHVETSRLLVDGVAWATGGRETVKTLLRLQLRDEALERYRTAEPAERILILKRLGEDPGAEATLKLLLEQNPLDAADIERTLARHVKEPPSSARQ